MAATGSHEEKDSTAAAPAEKKENLTILAWVVVALTAAALIVGSGSNPTIGWLFVGIAVLAVACSALAVLRSNSKVGGALALIVAVGLLVYSVMGILTQREQMRDFRHASNEADLTCLEQILKLHYERNQKFPEELMGLKLEAEHSFLDATIYDFLSYRDPKTGEARPWIYEKIAANECIVKSSRYAYEGEEKILMLRGKDGEVVREDAEVD